MKKTLFSFTAAVVLLTCIGGVSAQDGEANQLPGPIYLTIENFLDDRFDETIPAALPAIRANLAANYSNEPVDWSTVDLRIDHVGEPTLSFVDVKWDKVGFTSRSFSPVAVEAYFNCTAGDQTRTLNQTDVVTSEATETRGRSRSETDRVKSSLSLTYTPPSVGYSGFSFSGGLGGSAAREWEETIVNSETYQSITKETTQSTSVLSETITIPSNTLRYNEYSEQIIREQWFVWAKPQIDIGLAVKYRIARKIQEEYTEWRENPGLARDGDFAPIPTRRTRTKTIFEDRTRNAGRWRMFVADERRSLTSAAILDVEKSAVFSGPVDVTFPDSNACLEARRRLEMLQTNIESLTREAAQLVRQNAYAPLFDSELSVPQTESRPVPMSLSLGLATAKTTIPAIHGQTIELKPDTLQQVEFRAKSLGPGFCSVIVGLGPDRINLAATPLSWSSWQKLPAAHSGGAFSIQFSPQCDVGAIGQIRYFAP